MKKLLTWAITNVPAMNLLMLTVFMVGFWSLNSLNRETFPNFDLDMIFVSVPYPGATPEEVEESICQKIEENIRDIRGIKKITSAAAENSGTVSIELKSNVDDPIRVLNEVESAVGRISTFPELCERPVTQLLEVEETILRIGVLGPPDWSVDAQLRLREVAEQVRADVLRIPKISRVDIQGAKDYQIDVEFDENTLRSYGLTLEQVAGILRCENHQQAGGTIRGKSQEILLRSDTKQDIGAEIAKLPLLGVAEGATLTVGDLGTVRDEFVDVACDISIRRVEGTEDGQGAKFAEDRPLLAIAVQRNPEEDLFGMIDSLHEYLKTAQVPAGYDLISWGDRSTEVRDRLAMLGENGIQGLIIVFLCLTLFLDLRLSVWVALGIPFALLGTCAVMYLTGNTLNMISTFAMLMGLGIVVDDAIVIGENVYTHRLAGNETEMESAINGVSEVFPSVFASITTTIIAFSPLLFVAGMMGKMMFIMPMVIITILLFSLCESCSILPAHLSHSDNLVFRFFRTVFYLFRWMVYLLKWMSKYTMASMEWYIHHIYRPSLEWSLKNRSIFLTTCFGLMFLSLGLIAGRKVSFVLFPRMDSTSIVCNIQFPNGTPESLTAHYARQIEDAYWRVSDELQKETGQQVSIQSVRTIGSNMSGRGHGGGASGGSSSYMASVEVELVDATDRSVESSVIIDRWRDAVGSIPGALVLTFDSAFGGPGGNPIEFKLLAPAQYADEMEEAVARCKAKLVSYDGVYDVRDDNLPGKWEFRPQIRDFATTQGVRQSDIATVLRNAYYGAEVMRLQRGRHEVKLMVRYPEEARTSLASFDELRVRINGVERPIGELADVTIQRGYSTINRLDQMRAITITANVDDTRISPNQVIADMQGLTGPGTSRPRKEVAGGAFFPELFEEFPHIQIKWEGQREQEQESFQSMKVGFLLALLGMFVLLTLQFKSYHQPLIIMSIIPFAGVIVIYGHFLCGMQLTFLGVFGLIALAGIVVNDAIVLVDFINTQVRQNGMNIHNACLQAGLRRFRPVILTTVTTVGGLLPICFETSFQAKMVIPMAFTIAVGTAGATLLTLYLVPVLYSVYGQLATRVHSCLNPATEVSSCEEEDDAKCDEVKCDEVK